MKRLLLLALLAAPASYAQSVADQFGQYPSDPFSCTPATSAATYYNTASNAVLVCNGTSWLPFVNGSGTVNTIPKFTPDATTLGNSTITDDGTVVTTNTATTMRAAALGDGTAGFLNVTGTLPASPSAKVSGSFLNVTSAGSASFIQDGFSVQLYAGYTGPSATRAGTFFNAAAGTAASAFLSGTGNFGVTGAANAAAAAAHNVGVVGSANNNGAGGLGIGVLGRSNAAGINGIGVAGFSVSGSSTNIGGYFALGNTAPTLTTTALLVDNFAVAAPIAIFRDNGTPVLTVGDSTTVTGATTIKGEATNVDYFLKVSGALAATTTSTGVLIETTTSGVDAGTRSNFASIMGAGYAGAGQTILSYVDNQASGSGGNIGTTSYSSGAGVGSNTGIYGAAFNSTTFNQGVLGLSYNSSAGSNIGGQFRAVNPGAGTKTGLYAGLDGTTPTLVSSAFIADNAAETAPIAIFRDNGTPVLTVGDSASVTGTTTVTGAMTGDSQTSNFLNVTGTMPGTTTALATGARLLFTTQGSSSFQQRGLWSQLNAGYTGSSSTISGVFVNNSAGTGTNYGVLAGNIGVQGSAQGNTTGANIGSIGYSFNAGNGDKVAGLFYADGSAAGTGNSIGAIGFGRKGNSTEAVGVVATIRSGGGLPTITTTALLADNQDLAAPIALFMDNSVTKVSIEDGGKLLLASGNFIEGTEAAAPGTPAAGQVILYAKSGSPGEFCSKDDSGSELCMSSGSGGSGISYAEAAAAVLAGF